MDADQEIASAVDRPKRQDIAGTAALRNQRDAIEPAERMAAAAHLGDCHATEGSPDAPDERVERLFRALAGQKGSERRPASPSRRTGRLASHGSHRLPTGEGTLLHRCRATDGT